MLRPCRQEAAVGKSSADMSTWADLIADGTVKRVEIAVIPTLEDADGVTLALDAPSRTFDLGANDFDDGFYSPIVKVEDGCENCHDALATNYHSPDRGGNIVVCRMCHITKSGGSHLEMQSRSIDSYAHAIHSMPGIRYWRYRFRRSGGKPCTMSITSSSRIPRMESQTVSPATLKARTTCRISPHRYLVCFRHPILRSMAGTETSVMYRFMSPVPLQEPVVDATGLN